MLRSLAGACALFAAAAGVTASAQSVSDRVAAADPANGADIFKKCRVCHTIAEGGPHRVGPNLWGIVGREVASADGYTRYSPAMKAHGGTWDIERLDVYLTEPRAVVPKTRMVFPGVANAEDRADLIAYLNQLGPEPILFDTAQGPTSADEPPDVGPESDYGLLVDAPGVEETHTYCTACHSEMIVAQQGKTRKHWADLLVWMMEEQGMPEIAEPDRSVILDYLAANYPEGPERLGVDPAMRAEAPYGLLVDEPGVEEANAYCTACHSEMIVVQQGKTRAQWDKQLRWMVKEQGMAEIDEPDRSIILDYLAAHYNTDRPNFPRR